MPKASVLMPVYNQQKYLGESIVSVLKQTESDFELIIVDDGSTDKSYEIAEYYASIDPRVTVKRLKENSGQAIATNYGAKFATSDYIAWHHADDDYHKDFLKKTLAAKTDVVYGAYQFISVDGDKGNMPYDLDNFTWDREKFKKQCYLCCGAMLYTRKAFDEVGGYDESFVTSVDWDFSLRATLNREVVVIPEVLFYYRAHHIYSNRQRISEGIRDKDRKRIKDNVAKGVYDV